MGDKHVADSDKVKKMGNRHLPRLADKIGRHRDWVAKDLTDGSMFAPLFGDLARKWAESVDEYVVLLNHAKIRLEDTGDSLVDVARDYERDRADNDELIEELEIVDAGQRQYDTGGRETEDRGNSEARGAPRPGGAPQNRP